MEIRRLGAKLFHVDGQTDKHDETNSRFSQFCAPGLITLTVNNALEKATKITTTVLLEILFIKLTIYIVQSVHRYVYRGASDARTCQATSFRTPLWALLLWNTYPRYIFFYLFIDEKSENIVYTRFL
jgi:hypothetical protein